MGMRIAALIAWTSICLAGVAGAQSVVESVEAGESGVRFRCSGAVQSVSGRLDFRGRVVVTMVGQGLGQDVAPVWDEAALVNLDGSGSLQGLSLEPTETSSGLQLVSAVLVPKGPVTFRVSVDGRDVVVDLEDGSQGSAASSPERESNRDPSTGRRVLTAADLEPIPGEPANSGSQRGGSSSAAAAERVLFETVGRVNLRPQPTLDSVPLMTLPDATPLVGGDRNGNWQRVQLGELEGWVDSALLEVRTQTATTELIGANPAAAEAELGSADSEDFDLGEPGAWLERLSEAAQGAPEAPTWDGLRGVDPALLSERELANRERALQESTARRLETAEQDLRQARAESAELRIDLARANQQLELALEQLDVATARVAELEAVLPSARAGAVESRAQLERSQAAQQALTSELERSNQARRRLESQAASLFEDQQTARSEVAALQIEADGLREALRRAEAELLARRTSPSVATAPLENLSAAGAARSSAVDAPVAPLSQSTATQEASVVSGPAGRELVDEPLQVEVAETDAPTGRNNPGITQSVEPLRTSSASPDLATVAGALRSLVESLLGDWAAAWSAQDVERYTAFYSSSLETPLGSFSAWLRKRTARLQQPAWIEVEVDLETVEVSTLNPEGAGPPRLRVAFLQMYRSADYQDVVQKVIVLGLEGDAWRIQREQAAEVLSLVATPR